MCKCSDKCEQCKGYTKECDCMKRELVDGILDTSTQFINKLKYQNRQLKIVSCGLGVCLLGAVIGLIAL